MREERNHEIWRYCHEFLNNYGCCKEITNFGEFDKFYCVLKLTWLENRVKWTLERNLRKGRSNDSRPVLSSQARVI